MIYSKEFCYFFFFLLDKTKLKTFSEWLCEPFRGRKFLMKKCSLFFLSFFASDMGLICFYGFCLEGGKTCFLLGDGIKLKIQKISYVEKCQRFFVACLSTFKENKSSEMVLNYPTLDDVLITCVSVDHKEAYFSFLKLFKFMQEIRMPKKREKTFIREATAEEKNSESLFAFFSQIPPFDLVKLSALTRIYHQNLTFFK